MTASLSVPHHDNHLLFTVKPAGRPSVPDESGDESQLEYAKQWVRVEYNKPGDVFLGVVHRLDRPVSGIVLFARTSKAASRLTASFRDRTTEKVYLGVVFRAPRESSGTIEHYLRKDSSRNHVSIVPEGTEGAKLARTQWRVLRATESGGALLELRPETGRSHQLRVACASLGSPLLGDLKYGAPDPLPDRSIALHATRLVVPHPTRKEPVSVECKPPAKPWWK